MNKMGQSLVMVKREIDTRMWGKQALTTCYIITGKAPYVNHIEKITWR